MNKEGTTEEEDKTRRGKKEVTMNPSRLQCPPLTSEAGRSREVAEAGIGDEDVGLRGVLTEVETGKGGKVFYLL